MEGSTKLAKVSPEGGLQVVDARSEVRVGTAAVLDLASLHEGLEALPKLTTDAESVALHRKGVSLEIRERGRAAASQRIRLSRDGARKAGELAGQNRIVRHRLLTPFQGIRGEGVGLVPR